MFGEYHGSSKGRSSDVIDFVATAPEAPTLSGEDVVVFASPTPTGNLDVYMQFDGAGSNEYVGVGFGAATGEMGPGEFYTGRAGVLIGSAVTDRYIGEGNGKPDARGTSNVLSSECAYDGPVLKCSFTRPLEDASSDAVSLEAGNFFLRYAAGTLNGANEITYHTERGNSATSLSLYNVITDSLASGTAGAGSYKAHAIIMIVAWLFLLPYGIFVARFRVAVRLDAGQPALWFQIHQPVQCVGVCRTARRL